MSDWTHHRARVASLSRIRPADDPELIQARRDLKAARLEDYVSRTLATAPPLTDEQRAHVVRLLRPVAANGGGRR
ncbi:hypothetical protein ACTXPS_08625 [Brachybacterium tyrofermentans]|uniref:hypothetical protein n=1 Tax=Brachybacterium tyrofermentans TaxID=47848 RepID=UPI003FD627E4